MAQHTLTIDQAGEIDAAWVNAGSPRDCLRLVSYRKAGNGSTTMLCCPGDEYAPVYEYHNGSYVHISGPEIKAGNEDRYTIMRLVQYGVKLRDDDVAMEAEYQDERDTQRSLREGLHQ